METEGMNLKDVVDAGKRRKWSLLIPALSVFAVAAIVAFALPSIYRSTSTILIEEQEIPPELVMTTVTSYAEQRLQVTNQRIMSSTRLLEIINRFNLYRELKDRWTTEEIVAKMRKDIKLETISADVIDRRSGAPKQATIAFSLGYSGKSPETVQQIANVLASLYLEENLKVREQQTSSTSKFLEDEMKRVQAELAVADGKIAEYKRRNLQSLPELVAMNLSEQTQVETSLLQLGEQMKSLKEKESYLQEQLATTPQEDTNPDKMRLNDLRARLVDLSGRYSEDYPDVKRTKFAIAELERQFKATDDSPASSRPSNPAYQGVTSQLAATRSDLDSVKRQIELFKGRQDALRRTFAASPRVEEGFKALISERNSLQGKNDDLSRKFMEAKVAHGLEKEQMGERFTIIDAARLPEKPVSPNRPAILLIGLILGLGAGVGAAAMRELSDHSVRTTGALATGSGFPVLGGIPVIRTPEEAVGKSSRLRLALAGAATALVLGILIVHIFVMDLDIVWAKLGRRLG